MDPTGTPALLPDTTATFKDTAVAIRAVVPRRPGHLPSASFAVDLGKAFVADGGWPGLACPDREDGGDGAPAAARAAREGSGFTVAWTSP